MPDKQNKEARRVGRVLPSDTKALPQRVATLSSWGIPLLLKRALPRWLVLGLREFKGRALTWGTVWDLPRHVEFEQSLQDQLASASMSVVIPIHDAPSVTARCLASLERYAPQAEIILVDDASSLTETLEVIRRFSNRNGWRVVRHDDSLGHSKACRSGAIFATRRYLCLLNSDTVVTPWCWRQAANAFEEDLKIGVVGPSTSSSGNSQTLEIAAQLRPYWNDSQICAFAERLLTESPQPTSVDLPWVSGFAFFIRRTLWEHIGGFDEKLPDYGNENELCRRLADAGYRSVWVRNSYIHHLGGQSYRKAIGDDAILARIRAALGYIEQKHSSSGST